MNSWRGTSIATGSLFILATIAALAAAALDPSLTGLDDLTAVTDRPDQLAVAALLYLIAAASSVGIAIALYPLLRQINVALALGSVVFRTIEAVLKRRPRLAAASDAKTGTDPTVSTNGGEIDSKATV